MKYNLEDRVFIKTLKKKAVIKGLDGNKLKLTYFLKDTDERKTEWFDVKDVQPYRQKHKIKQRKKDTVYFAKVKPQAIIPTKRYEDGCYDVYICPDETDKYIVIEPHTYVKVGTGIASAFSPKYRIDVSRERGSTGFGLKVNSAQIDSGYRGEWFIKLHNITNKKIVISSKFTESKEFEDRIEYPITKAICQAAIEFVPNVNTEEIPYEKLEKIPSERGKGKEGSSGK